MTIRWSTESNAFENSITKHRTYLLVSSILEIVLVISTSEAVVLPVGLNPNRSYNLAGVIAGENMVFNYQTLNHS